MELQSNLVNSKCSGLEILLQNMCGSRGGDRGSSSPPPLKNYKFIGFPSNTGPDPLKITKLPSQHSMMDHYWPASETPFQWRFAGRPIIAGFWWSLGPLSPKKKTNFFFIRVGPPLTKFSGSAHAKYHKFKLLGGSHKMYNPQKYFYQLFFCQI